MLHNDTSEIRFCKWQVKCILKPSSATAKRYSELLIVKVVM